MSGPHSIIYGHAAKMSVVETIIFTTEMDLSKAETIISAFLTGFFAAQIVISAAEKIAGAVPAGQFANHQPGGDLQRGRTFWVATWLAPALRRQITLSCGAASLV